ncbi:NADH:ubiquinone oxidoreductase subunit J [Thiocapsa imhoffii]|uniref:NADH-quinone oxidoreductase subunit J n=1 Tax=Thiocapsa imhoffii TaxID=382777 RepID=A0A9X1B8X3_9GAMM|nr:NADH-quinone oxidoreductase subunit J [Thiocapsa imhoffii]MBK1644480.1 NADH:ubiquinone oxidoreductase subunit J [Thiocapsa imhoffii]
MGFEKFLFYVFAAITLYSSGMVITRRNPVHAVLYLVLAFISSAALWILLEAEFLGIVLVLVYVGAVMVLFLFVVMMLDIEIDALRAGFIRYLPLGAVIAVVLALEIFLVVGPGHFGLQHFPKPPPVGSEFSNTEALGLLLYTVYVYPFEIAAVILLVAIIAAIRLTLRHRPVSKYLDPAAQVRVKKGPDRIRIVQMPTEGVAGPTASAGAGAKQESTE